MEMRKKGFTLLELLLTITIISVLLGMTLPVINKSIKSLRFEGFVDKAYLFLDYTRTASSLRNKILSLKLDQENKRIYLNQEGESSGFLKDLEVPSRLKVEFDPAEIIFYPNGTSREFKITISSSQGMHSIISSKGFDGKIRVGSDDEI